MTLDDYYKNLYQASINKILNDDYIIDNLIDSAEDNRFGITLLVKPPIKVKSEIQKFLDALKLIDDKQYFYQNSDIHVTIMSIISCYNGFKLENVDISKYKNVIYKSLKDCSSFKISFRGVTVSPSCIMIQGFCTEDTLDQLRNNLRYHFKKSSLEQSIDKRYRIHTAHSTVVRFKDKISNKTALLQKLEDYRNFDFGTFGVNHLELVFNDWYQSKKHVKVLHHFQL